MPKEKITDSIFVAMLTLIFAFFIFILGMDITNQSWKRDAVEKGHAEYYLDQNDLRQWRWLPSCAKDKDNENE